MANTIQIKRGLKENVGKTTLAQGELAVALDTQELYVGLADGTTALVKGAASGVVDTATKLDTARNIELTGDATGNADFDGSKDIEIAVALAKSGVTAGTYAKVTVDDRGIVTAGASLETSDLPTIVITDITGLQDALDAKANNSSVYSKSDIDTKLDDKADASDFTALETTVTGHTTKITNIETVLNGTPADTEAGTEAIPGLVAKVDNLKTSFDIELAKKADKTDVYTKTEVDTELAKKADSATTLAGYGITDAYTKTEVDTKLTSVYKYAGSVADKTVLPTGSDESPLVIGTVYNVEDTGANYAWNGTEWDNLGGTVDLTSYYTKTETDDTFVKLSDYNTAIAAKANASDVYTKTEVDTIKTTLENDKADKATTLAGYGITDVYTKTEVDTIKTTLETSIGKKIGTTDVIDGGTF